MTPVLVAGKVATRKYIYRQEHKAVLFSVSLDSFTRGVGSSVFTLQQDGWSYAGVGGRERERREREVTSSQLLLLT